MLTLLTAPAPERDLGLLDAALDAVLAQVLTDDPDPDDGGLAAAVAAVRAHAPGLEPLSEGERRLLGEWLDRVGAGR